jgi:hypothetical protein
MENALGRDQYVVATRRFRDEALEPQGPSASILGSGGCVLKCDVCDQEFANSEEVKRHKEQAHPMGDGNDPDTSSPELMESSEMREGKETP